MFVRLRLCAERRLKQQKEKVKVPDPHVFWQAIITDKNVGQGIKTAADA